VSWAGGKRFELEDLARFLAVPPIAPRSDWCQLGRSSYGRHVRWGLKHEDQVAEEERER
jgi:hypothetical protein